MAARFTDPTPASLEGESEEAVAAWIDFLADGGRRPELLELLCESHLVYRQRGAAAVARIRAWVLLRLSRNALSDEALPFVMEELQSGVDPYLVAAAAHTLRAYPQPRPEFAAAVAEAFAHVADRNSPVSLETYGGLAARSETSALRELILAVEWLGPAARKIRPRIQALRDGPFPRKLRADLDRALASIHAAIDAEGYSCCPASFRISPLCSWKRTKSDTCPTVTFEDQIGRSVHFDEFFRGRPSIVVFFYTRCDNPLKCSLTVTKLARLQNMAEERGIGGRIRTAAITYDPEFDAPARLRAYVEARGLALDADHRVLRAVSGNESLREYFSSGVNFVESLVNRHRIEAYVLDSRGRVTCSFERLSWDEAEVLDCAAQLLRERNPGQVFGAASAVLLAVFPKCPVCWAAYLSVFGFTALEQLPYAPWLQPLLWLAALMNVASVYLRTRSTSRMTAACFTVAGLAAVLLSKFGWPTALPGIALTLAGSVTAAFAPGQMALRLRAKGPVW